MTTFDRREEAFENMFAHDQEMEFRAKAHRDRILANWAAGQMGLSDEETAAYETAIIAFAIENGDDQALLNRICHDLDAAGKTVPASDVRAQMDRLTAEALRHVKTV